MAIECYSGGYVDENLNFKISRFQFNNEIDKKIKGVLCVLKNILFRGTPTKASVYLLEEKQYKDKPNELKNIFRFQVALLELMLDGYLKFDGNEYKFQVFDNSDYDYKEDAVKDLFDWISNLFCLANISPKFPKIIFTDVLEKGMSH